MLLSLSFFVLGSCGKKPDSDLVIKISPNESLVLEMSAYSCQQIVDGIKTDNGVIDPAIKGPVVLFNKLSLQWKRSTKLFIHQAKIKFTGSGIQGGESSCELTQYLPSFFESTAETISLRVPATPATTAMPLNQLQAAMYNASTFEAAGTIVSNPKCRVACSLPLVNAENPEISAAGELTVKASELTNEGTEEEKYFRIKSKFKIRVVP